MFYYTEVHLLDHHTQWIKMHGETEKYRAVHTVSDQAQNWGLQNTPKSSTFTKKFLIVRKYKLNKLTLF
jgi:hypothetical protein